MGWEDEWMDGSKEENISDIFLLYLWPKGNNRGYIYFYDLWQNKVKLQIRW